MPRRGLQGQGPPLLVGRNVGAGKHGPPQRSAVSSGREPWWSLPRQGAVPGPGTEQEGLRAARCVPRAHSAHTGTSSLLPTLRPVLFTAGRFLCQGLLPGRLLASQRRPLLGGPPHHEPGAGGPGSSPIQGCPKKTPRSCTVTSGGHPCAHGCFFHSMLVFRFVFKPVRAHWLVPQRTIP